MADWYDNIEPWVREAVRYLRNEGFNTTCSCEHEMLIQIDCNAEDLPRLWTVLCEWAGNPDSWDIAFHWHDWHRFAEVRFRMPDGSPNPGWRSGRDWAGNRYVSPAEGG